MEDIKEEIEYGEISSILDSDGNVIKEFKEPKKSKIHKKEIYIKSNTVTTIIIISALIAAIIFVMIKLIPIVLGIALLNVIINKIIKIIKK